MSAPFNLIWFRVLHWQFALPMICLACAYCGLYLRAENISDGVVLIVLPTSLLLIAEGIRHMKYSTGYKPDEREQADRLKSVGVYSASIGMVALVGSWLLSLQDYFSSMWVPKNQDDWRAVFWLLIATGVGSRMISERMRALLPLDNDSLDVEDVT